MSFQFQLGPRSDSVNRPELATSGVKGFNWIEGQGMQLEQAIICVVGAGPVMLLSEDFKVRELAQAALTLLNCINCSKSIPSDTARLIREAQQISLLTGADALGPL